MAPIFRIVTHTCSALSLVTALTACGGGGDDAPPLPPAPATPAFGSFNVYNSIDPRKNGTFVPRVSSNPGENIISGAFGNDFTEVMVEWNPNGSVVFAYLIYNFDIANRSAANEVFACLEPSIPCAGVTADLLNKRVKFDRATLTELVSIRDLSRKPGGSTVVVDGSFTNGK